MQNLYCGQLDKKGEKTHEKLVWPAFPVRATLILRDVLGHADSHPSEGGGPVVRCYVIEIPWSAFVDKAAGSLYESHTYTE